MGKKAVSSYMRVEKYGWFRLLRGERRLYNVCFSG